MKLPYERRAVRRVNSYSKDGWGRAARRSDQSPVSTRWFRFAALNQPVATFGFADEHEARIARALMIRAISNAVLIVSHTTVTYRNSDLAETDPHAVRGQQSLGKGALHLAKLVRKRDARLTVYQRRLRRRAALAEFWQLGDVRRDVRASSHVSKFVATRRPDAPSH